MVRIPIMENFDFINDKIPDGLSVIEASAGTGKTFSISHLVARMVLKGASIRDILLVTFTNDAAGELAERTRRVLADLDAPPAPDEATKSPGVHLLRNDSGLDFAANKSRIRQALQDIDLLSVSTIHSFCQSVLKSEGPLCGVASVPELIPDADDLVQEALHDEWLGRIAANPTACAALQAANIDPEKHARFLEKAMVLADFDPIPKPRPFHDLLAGFEAFPAKFTDGVCDELLEAVGADGSRLDSAPPLEKIQSLIEDLRQAEFAGAFSFLDACRLVQDAPSWMRAGSKAQKAAKLKVQGLDAVRLCTCVNALVGSIGWAWLNDSSASIKKSVGQSLQSNRLITYDGLITTVHRALCNEETADKLIAQLRAKHKFALIDESQDTDARQFAIFSKIFTGSPGHSLVLIGDPKQSIYSFRGADVNTYLGAKAAAKATFSLSKTFRAPQQLVDAVNALFSRPRAFLKDGLEFHSATSGKTGDCFLKMENEEAASRIEVWIAPDDTKEYSDKKKRLGRISDAVASEIVKILNGGGKILDKGASRSVVPSDFAVLVAKHEQADAICSALRKSKVPAIQSGAQDVMASDEAAEILAILKAVNEPRKSKLRNAALTTRLLGLTDSDLKKLELDADAQSRVHDSFLAWQALWQSRGVVALLSKIDAEKSKFSLSKDALDSGNSIALSLAGREDAERRITNFRHLLEILAGAQAETGGRPNELIRWFAQDIQRAKKSSADLEERQLRLESDDDAVKVVTMHSAKGLEYNLVVCPFLWDAKEPGGIQKLNRPAPANPAVVDTELAKNDPILVELARTDLEDRLRLAYVAITRAKVKAWIYAGEVCGSNNRPSASPLDWIFRTEENPEFDAWRTSVKTAGRGARHNAGLEILMAASGLNGAIVSKNPPEPSEVKAILNNPADGFSFEPEPPPSFPSRYWRTTSFSQLTKEKNPKGGPSKPRGDAEETGNHANAFALAKGGTQLGTAVHGFLEAWDFAAVPGIPELETHFARYALGANLAGLPEAFAGMLGGLRQSTLPGLQCSIAQACATPKTTEWQFHLPAREGFGVSSIAELFRKHGDTEYATSLEALGDDALEGFLQGFIDKIAFHSSAYGVIDWKTNKLPAYDAHSLREAARSSHYWLQAHLYLVALRRHLGPKADVRGAWLVYLRGVRGGESDGVLFIKTDTNLLDDLDHLFTRP
jgi:exodeoxyribonuclease V beta subunit